MIGVVIGIGDKWRSIARASADRMSRMTGLRCEVFDHPYIPTIHPSWQKAFIIQRYAKEDSFLCFDADIICLRQWDPERLFNDLGRAFCAVPDDHSEQVFKECEFLNISFPGIYVNAGLMMFGREHDYVWDRVWTKHPHCGAWLEQGALNLALLNMQVEICRLPRKFNVLAHQGQMAPHESTISIHKNGWINLHACSCKTPEQLVEVQKRFGLYDTSSIH